MPTADVEQMLHLEGHVKIDPYLADRCSPLSEKYLHLEH
jgi:hypothetical protein